MKARLVHWALVLGSLGCAEEDKTEAPQLIDVSALDQSVDPCSDFYRFACGGWQKKHKLANDAAIAQRAADAYYAMVPKLRQILDAERTGQVGADDPEGAATAAYLESCLYTSQQTRDSLAAELKAVYATTSSSELMQLVGRFRRRSSISFMRFSVWTDPEDATRRVLWLEPGGWEMPARDDYVEPARQARRDAYVLHMRALSELFPITFEPAAALAVETSLASAALEPDQLTDPRSLHHRMTLAELEALAPNVPFRILLDAQGLDASGPIEVTEPEFVRALGKLFETQSLANLQHYLAWQFLQDQVPYLDVALRSLNFMFWGPEFSGRTQEPTVSWTCFESVTDIRGWALSKPYLARNSGLAAREHAKDYLTDIRAAMRRRLQAQSWTDDASRAEALTKLDAMVQLVGFPDQWPEYPEFVFDKTDYLANHWQITEHNSELSSQALTRDVDRDSWSIAPLVVNAFYRPSGNQMVFPAGILQSPFLEPNANAASNLGAIGSVMGHELTHGFDSSGRFYDADGNLGDIWTEATTQAYEARAACVESEYSKFEVLPGQTINGRLTLGENIADLGGVRLAFDALRQRAETLASWNGFDAEQQFFLAYAQTYCENVRPEFAEARLLSDAHSPGVARVNVVLANLPEFAQAFGCSEDARMVSSAACEVW